MLNLDHFNNLAKKYYPFGLESYDNKYKQSEEFILRNLTINFNKNKYKNLWSDFLSSLKKLNEVWRIQDISNFGHDQSCLCVLISETKDSTIFREVIFHCIFISLLENYFCIYHNALTTEINSGKRIQKVTFSNSELKKKYRKRVNLSTCVNTFFNEFMEVDYFDSQELTNNYSLNNCSLGNTTIFNLLFTTLEI